MPHHHRIVYPTPPNNKNTKNKCASNKRFINQLANSKPCISQGIKALVLGGLTSVLAGCTSLPEVPKGEMLLDIKRQVLCYSNATNCFELSFIVANSERDRILRAYGLYPWNWDPLKNPQQLVELLLQGSKSSSNQQQPSYRKRGKHQFILPINQQTLTVWSVLKGEYYDRYSRD